MSYILNFIILEIRSWKQGGYHGDPAVYISSKMFQCPCFDHELLFVFYCVCSSRVHTRFLPPLEIILAGVLTALNCHCLNVCSLPRTLHTHSFQMSYHDPEQGKALTRNKHCTVTTQV